METSAKNSTNVQDAFLSLARDIKTKMEKKMVRYLISFTLFCYTWLLLKPFSRLEQSLWIITHFYDFILALFLTHSLPPVLCKLVKKTSELKLKLVLKKKRVYSRSNS